MTQAKQPTEEYKQKERERAKRNREKQGVRTGVRTSSTPVRTEEYTHPEEWNPESDIKVEFTVNDAKDAAVLEIKADTDAEMEAIAEKIETPEQVTVTDPRIVEPIQIDLMRNAEGARTLVMRYIMMLKAQGWRRAEIQAKDIS